MFFSAFQMKYNTKSIKKLPKINNSEKWLIIDVRPKEEWLESHITNSINIPHHLFRLIYSKKVIKDKKILFISSAGHSHLDLYRLLKKHNFKVYILMGGWKKVHHTDELDKILTYNPID
ncbi:MAG: rhodanese-like domain-containing protein [Spiroplasma poulsonii]|uniref:Rhodanese-like domain n=2 Tax=Spiroplasma poulsonii TaxID=2138 RepID=A0A2P6FB00_9MOLU|nr:MULTISPECIES: rhodanese-like domain-containing protein [Spiroplasma]KAF0851819.1 Rhodanese-like domain [Spiroplasma poulsonii]MBH8622426.1 rhodanese-like domain-containing protein [Spiroplasma sp. hyd1]MBW1241380.1 rhodanese-like domain-containing protein [Spiroplasma poulsonii]PQM30606.1 Rhodanese-like domain [Spiroplasma poulsonii]PWF98366.1 Rhodanese-like domain protein [Spiroplasma poulsonii]